MHAEPPSSPTAAAGGRHWLDLPWDLLADIHGRLRFTDCVAFVAVFGDLFKPEAPCLVLPNDPTSWYKTIFFSINDHEAGIVRACPLRDYDLLGCSGGWLAMADKERRMHLVNPVTGKQHALPAITTMVGLDVTRFFDPCDSSINGIGFHREEFLAIRFGRLPYPDKPCRPYRPSMVYAWCPEMRNRLYRKVVLSASARPSCYAAMLILAWKSYNIPAFATAEDPAWRVASPRADVMDGVHHKGRFYSLGRTGIVEAWDQKELTNEVVASRLDGEREKGLVTTPDGRLVVVLWDEVCYHPGSSSKYSFKVQVLDEASDSWQETRDIGNAALLVGAANTIMCVSTREHKNLKDNCVYFTDEVKRKVRVYSLRHRTTTRFEELAHSASASWKAAAWFTPSFS